MKRLVGIIVLVSALPIGACRTAVVVKPPQPGLVLVEGRWVKPPRAGAVWVPGHWERRGLVKKVWVPGHWRY